MRRTFDGIDAEIKQRLSNRTDITAEMRSQFINDAYRACANAYEHPQIQSDTTDALTSGFDSLTPSATDIWWPEWVFDTTNNYGIYQDALNRIEAVLKRTANPRKYMWRNSKFVFESKPSGTVNLKIFYVKKLVELSTGQTSILDELFDPYLVMKASVMAFQTVRDFKEAVIQEQQLTNYLAPLNLPLRKAKLNDKGMGFRVRMK